jgi:hypothetical protein
MQHVRIHPTTRISENNGRSRDRREGSRVSRQAFATYLPDTWLSELQQCDRYHDHDNDRDDGEAQHVIHVVAMHVSA